MPRSAQNKMPPESKRRYFELVRQGLSGSAASSQVGVSLSCGSLWFIDAGSVDFVDKPISRRYLTQDDRIEIADGLAVGEPEKAIAARIGKSYQSVYGRSRATESQTAAANPGTPTAKPTNVGSGPENAASPSIRRSGTSLPESLTSIGHPRKSAAGSNAAGQNAAPGMSAPRPSTKPSTVASSPPRTASTFALAERTAINAGAAGPVRAH
jgi:transposase